MRWTPLLKSDIAKTNAWVAIHEIAASLEHFRPDDATVASGAAGLALFWSYYATVTGDEVASTRASRLLENACALSTGLDSSFFSGWTGVGWVFEHLAPTTGDSDYPNAEIDKLVTAALGVKDWVADYDLIRGLTGLALYALERLPRASAVAALVQIVAHLQNTASRRSVGLTWHTRAELLPIWQRNYAANGWDNLGVAHGLPGTINVLARIVHMDISSSIARPLLSGAVSWLLAQRLSGTDSCFPTYLTETSKAPPPARSAWCYGDPGIAASLLGAARYAGVPAWESAAIEVARTAALRPVERCGVEDAALCHGSFGLAHVFLRLFHATGDEVLRDAAQKWFQHGLSSRRPGELFAGFPKYQQGSWLPSAGFLTGAAGIGLALLAAVSDLEPAWDRLLLIDIPAGGRHSKWVG